MDRQRNRDQPNSSRDSLSRLGGLQSTLLSGLPAPLLHGVSGSSGFWDEIVSFGLMGAVVVVLGLFTFFGRRRRGKRRDE
jgi:Na+/melibiose symporter-like transporter